MRWMHWLVRSAHSPKASAPRRAGLRILALEDRTVPHVSGIETADVIHAIDPVPTEVVKDETPPDEATHADDHSGEETVWTMTDLPPAVETDDVMLPTMSAESLSMPHVPLPQLGDLIWLDKDGDGVQGANEPGIGYVTVRLYEGATLVGSTTSDLLGFYSFNLWNVDNGTLNPDDNGLKRNTDYQIRIDMNQPALAGLVPASAVQGGNENRDSNGIANGSLVTINVNTGTNELHSNWDFGFAPTLSIGNQVWRDVNNNGKKDKKETGIGGVALRLLDSTGTNVIATTTTAADGTYLFSGLRPGTYIVEVVAGNFATGNVLSGYTSSTGKPGQSGVTPYEGVALLDGVVLDDHDSGSAFNGAVRSAKIVVHDGNHTDKSVDFGFFASTSVAGRVFIDANDNGQLDSTEAAGLAKVRLRLAGPAGVFTTTTDANGNYAFPDLPIGAYTLMQLRQPAGYRSTTPNSMSLTLSAGGAHTHNFGEATAVNLVLRQSANRGLVNVGGTFVVTYWIKNVGTRDASGLVLSIPLPPGLRFVKMESGGPTYDAATQRIALGTLAAGAQGRVRLRLQATRFGALPIRATVLSQQSDLAPANNSSAITLQAIPPMSGGQKTARGWLLGSQYR